MLNAEANVTEFECEFSIPFSTQHSALSIRSALHMDYKQSGVDIDAGNEVVRADSLARARHVHPGGVVGDRIVWRALPPR